MKNRVIVLLTCFLTHWNINVSGQDFFQDNRHLEIHFEYSHSLLKDGYKLVRIVRSQDSCYFDTRDTRPTRDTAWFMMKPSKTKSISCSEFNEILNSFNSIESREIMNHNNDLVIIDGYSFTLTLTNMNSNVTYSLHSPERTDIGIENFINTVDLMLKMDETTWKKILK